MFERFTSDARTVVVHAQEHARRLGHRYVGCEHVLLGLVATEAPAGAALRERGITPERVEEQIVRDIGLGAGASLFAGIDRDALASIGVDLDAVRARIEASFPDAAFMTTSQGAERRRRRRRHRVRSVLRRCRPARLGAAVAPPAASAPATGRYRSPGALPTGHLPFTPGAKRALQMSLREAVARHDNYIGVEHVALALLANDSGPIPPILSALGSSAPTLRLAIQDRYRQAG